MRTAIMMISGRTDRKNARRKNKSNQRHTNKGGLQSKEQNKATDKKGKFRYQDI